MRRTPDFQDYAFGHRDCLAKEVVRLKRENGLLMQQIGRMQTACEQMALRLPVNQGDNHGK